MIERMKNKSNLINLKIEKFVNGLKSSDERGKILAFFREDVNDYLERLKKIIQGVASMKISPQKAFDEYTKLTNKILIKGDELEQSIIEKKCGKTNKTTFQRSCW